MAAARKGVAASKGGSTSAKVAIGRGETSAAQARLIKSRMKGRRK